MPDVKPPKTLSVATLLLELKRQTKEGCCLAPLYSGITAENLTFCKLTAEEKEHKRCAYLAGLVEAVPLRSRFTINAILQRGRVEEDDVPEEEEE